MSRDPIEEEGGWNLFVFIGNNPLNGIDPLGISAWDYFGPMLQMVGGALMIATAPAIAAIPIPGAQILAVGAVVFGANALISGGYNLGAALAGHPSDGDFIRATVSSTVMYATSGNERAARYSIYVVNTMEVVCSCASITPEFREGITIATTYREVIGVNKTAYVITSKMRSYWEGVITYRNICGFERIIKISGIAAGTVVETTHTVPILIPKTPKEPQY